jgi:hypothetical protein
VLEEKGIKESDIYCGLCANNAVRNVEDITPKLYLDKTYYGEMCKDKPCKVGILEEDDKMYFGEWANG